MPEPAPDKAASNRSAALVAWRKLSGLPGGKWLFSRLICFKAPYFGSIGAQFVALAPGASEVRMRKRRAITNHIGTVHAIAMCNLAELAAGTMTDATVAATHRWIPIGMTVEYLKKATTDLRAIARLEPALVSGPSQDVPVTVDVLDSHDQTVFRAVITMRVSQRRAS